MKKQVIDYNDTFPTVLRGLMDSTHTTQRELAAYCNVRPQSISLYMNGETQPTPTTLVKIAEFYEVSVDYLLTGVSSRNTSIYRDLGLSEKSIEFLRKAKETKLHGENCLMPVIDELNLLLSDEDFHEFLDDAIFQFAMIRQEQDEPAGTPDDKEMLAFHIWQLQEFVRKFIYSLFEKRGIPIE